MLKMLIISCLVANIMSTICLAIWCYLVVKDYFKEKSNYYMLNNNRNQTRWMIFNQHQQHLILDILNKIWS